MANRQDDRTQPHERGGNSDMNEEQIRGLGEDSDVMDDDEFEDADETDEEDQEEEGSF